MTLSEEIVSLQRAAHELMYLGMDGSPVYSGISRVVISTRGVRTS